MFRCRSSIGVSLTTTAPASSWSAVPTASSACANACSTSVPNCTIWASRSCNSFSSNALFINYAPSYRSWFLIPAYPYPEHRLPRSQLHHEHCLQYQENITQSICSGRAPQIAPPLCRREVLFSEREFQNCISHERILSRCSIFMQKALVIGQVMRYNTNHSST